MKPTIHIPEAIATKMIEATRLFSGPEQSTLLEEIAWHTMREFKLWMERNPEQVRFEEVGELTLNTQALRQFDNLIQRIKAAKEIGLYATELREASSAMNECVKRGYQLPYYMAERGIRVRKIGKGWNYIHEEWDF